MRRLVVAMSRAKLGLYIFCRYTRKWQQRSLMVQMRSVAFIAFGAAVHWKLLLRPSSASRRPYAQTYRLLRTRMHNHARASARTHAHTTPQRARTESRTLAINSCIVVCACVMAAAHRSSRRATSCSRRSHSCSGGRPSRSCCWQRRSLSRAARMRRSTRRSRRARMHCTR